MPLQLSKLLSELYPGGVPLDALDMIEVEHDAGTLDSAVEPCGIVWAEAMIQKLPPVLKQPIMHLALVAREGKVSQPTTVRACVQTIAEEFNKYEARISGEPFGWIVVCAKGDIFVRDKAALTQALLQVSAEEIIPVLRKDGLPR